MPLVAPDEQRRAIRLNSLRVMPNGFGLTKITIPDCEYPVLDAQPLKMETPLPSARPLASPTVKVASSQCSFDTEGEELEFDERFLSSGEEDSEEEDEAPAYYEEFDPKTLPPGACAGQTICLPKECAPTLPPSATHVVSAQQAAPHAAPGHAMHTVVANCEVLMSFGAHAHDTHPHHAAHKHDESFDGNPSLSSKLSRRDSELSRSDTFPRSAPLTGKTSASDQCLSSPGSDARQSPSAPPRRQHSGRGAGETRHSAVDIIDHGAFSSGGECDDVMIDSRHNAVVGHDDEAWAAPSELTHADHVHMAAPPSAAFSPPPAPTTPGASCTSPLPQALPRDAHAHRGQVDLQAAQQVDLQAAQQAQAQPNPAPRRRPQREFQIAPNSPIPRMSFCFPPIRQFMGLKGKARTAEILGAALKHHAQANARALPSPKAATNAKPAAAARPAPSAPQAAAGAAHRAATVQASAQQPAPSFARKLSDPPQVQEVQPTTISAQGQHAGKARQRATQRSLSISTGTLASANTTSGAVGAGYYTAQPPAATPDSQAGGFASLGGTLIAHSPTASPAAAAMFAMGMPLSPAQVQSVQVRVGRAGPTPQARMVHVDQGVALTAYHVYSTPTEAHTRPQGPSVPPRAVKLVHTSTC
eukprot:CAMPEP_0206216432 /NCGR_PEP_ID=MMETSP0047_2-20121206/2718_1 /ASSEMBLY_ACC=CAM_ASM_000192 /TAXON_ID=195065 /ORGANISM="Chroomonas mesostigmatica_cf, Strain CCMP1168" /LENGTH=642 /DNA_ID=CAMNT_0053638779 /DNA_START=107 /DNA_END=2035 /DNA_ORIENTATION=+